MVVHPVRGQIQTVLKDGCLMISKKLAIKLIQELEDLEDGSIRMMSEETDPLTKWIQRLEEHPVFQDLPADVKSKLVMKLRVHNVCGNRRRRKLWKREGDVTVYLYSGKKSGYTYEKAVKELGGDHRKVAQVDVKNGSKWGNVYEELLSIALDGQISTVLTDRS